MKVNKRSNQRWILLGLVTALFGLMTLIFGNGLAYAEPLAPIISMVRVEPKLAKPGDPINVLIELSGHVTDATPTIRAQFISPNRKVIIPLDVTRRNDGIYQGALVPGAYWEEGIWRIDSLLVESLSGGYKVFNKVNYPLVASAEDLTGGDFEIVNPNADTAVPTVKAVSVDKTRVYLGETVTVSVETADNVSGVTSSLSLTYLDGAGLYQTMTMSQASFNKYTAAIKVDALTNAGSWKIHKLGLADKAGNAVEILNGVTTGTQNLSAANFTAYSTPPPDVTKPVISLNVDKTRVVPADVITLTLKATDASGITGRIYGSYKAPDYATNPSHVTKQFEFILKEAGIYQAQINLGPAMGVWIFDRVSVKDTAGNEAVLANKRLSSTGAGNDLDYLNITVGLNVTFDSQGGSAVPAFYTSTGTVAEPVAPTKTGWILSGWAKDPAGLSRWNFATDKATQSMTLYAIWSATPPVVVPPPVVEPAPAAYYAKTTATSLNFRTGPSTLYPSQGTIPNGSIVTVKAKEGTWFKIEYQGKPGYVSGTYIAAVDQSLIYQVKTEVNFRSGPSTAYPVIKKLTVGTYVQLLAKTTATFWQISVNGTKGYASAAYLTPASPLSAPPATTTPPPTTTPPTSQGWYMVNTAVNFRTGPATTYPVIRKLNIGDALSLISKVDATWWKVSVNGQIGFVSGKYVEPVVYPLVKYTTNDSVNFRTGPSTAYAIITKLPIQTPVTLVQKTTATWYKILANGKIGYLSAKYLTLAP